MDAIFQFGISIFVAVGFDPETAKLFLIESIFIFYWFIHYIRLDFFASPTVFKQCIQMLNNILLLSFVIDMSIV